MIAGFVLPGVKAYKRRLRLFEQFREENCPKTPRFQNFQQVIKYASKYDACIVGSDQVWNPSFNGSTPFYMLEHVAPAKRIAYAASFGVAKIEEGLKWRYRTRLRDFAAISTREASGADVIGELGLTRPDVVLDPTMLADSEQWRAWLDADTKSVAKYKKNAARFGEKYVLCYPLKSPKEKAECVRLTQKVQEKTGGKVLVLASDHLSKALKNNFNDVTVVDDVDPFEFVDLFTRASFVVTNSFHGSVFSILFHRKFYALLSEGQSAGKSTDSRLVDLFKVLGTSDRFISSNEDVDIESIPDYADVDERLAKLRAHSLNYLNAALQKTQTAKEPTLCEPDRCYGCAACVAKCPKNALTMTLDDEGFWRPHVDRWVCTQCGLCEQACPILNPPTLGTPEPKSYAAWNNDLETRRDCSSGGMFPIYATRTIERGGVVYGVAYDEQFFPQFVRVDNLAGLPALRSSKYAEAKVGTILRDVRDDLNAGRNVVFSGTPCQVLGLRSYLGKSFENLSTFDLCCHGAPSPVFLRKRLDALEKEKGEKVTGVRFRGKKLGWTKGLAPGNVYVTYESGEESDFRREDIFYTLAFTKNLSLRKSCEKCPCASISRAGDVTLADFWGLGYAKPFEHPRQDGVSLVLVNTAKGEKLVEESKENATFIERPLAEAINGNKTLLRPLPKHPRRNEFVADSMKMNYEKLEAKWHKEVFSGVPLWKRVAVKCKRFIYRVAKLH